MVPRPRDAIENRLAKRLVQRGITPETPVAAAVSGGGDSLALLCALAAFHSRLTVLHVHHGLRPEADADAAFVREFCRERNIPCEILAVKLKAGGNLEARARAARHRALRAACAERGIGVLLLAHQRDDLAETLLINLLRGAGSRGLGALRPWRKISNGSKPLLLGRPLLAISATALRAYLRAKKISWHEDESNRAGNLRAKLRHEILPALAKLAGRDLAPLLARSARLLARDEAHFAKQVRALNPHSASLSLATLRLLSPALRHRLLSAWFRTVRPGARGLALIHLHAADRLLRDGKSGDAIPWPGDWRVKRGRANFTLEKVIRS